MKNPAAESPSGLIDLLNSAVARELQVSIQYMFQHSLGSAEEAAMSADGSSPDQVRFVGTHRPYWLPGASLKKIAITEMRHAEAIAERVVAHGGVPTTTPAPITMGETAQEMLELDLDQEREAIRLYEKIIDAAQQAGDGPTAELFRKILADEERHYRQFAGLLGLPRRPIRA